MQSGAAVAVRAFTSYEQWSEAIGAVVGLIAGGVMYSFAEYKEAGKVAMASAVAGGLVRVAERMMKDKPMFGYAVIDNTKVLRGGGFGIVSRCIYYSPPARPRVRCSFACGASRYRAGAHFSF